MGKVMNARTQKKYVHWPRKAYERLISVYVKYPCLYDVSASDYFNRGKKFEAEEAMCDAVRDIIPNITTDECRRRYQSLRSQFKKEQAKVILSGEEYVPTFMYYNDLLFLRDTKQFKQNESPENNQQENNICKKEQNIEEEYDQQENNIYKKEQNVEEDSDQQSTQDNIMEEDENSEQTNDDPLQITSLHDSKVFIDFISSRLQFIDKISQKAGLEVQHAILELIIKKEKEIFSK